MSHATPFPLPGQAGNIVSLFPRWLRDISYYKPDAGARRGFFVARLLRRVFLDRANLKRLAGRLRVRRSVRRSEADPEERTGEQFSIGLYIDAEPPGGRGGATCPNLDLELGLRWERSCAAEDDKMAQTNAQKIAGFVSARDLVEGSFAQWATGRCDTTVTS